MEHLKNEVVAMVDQLIKFHMQNQEGMIFSAKEWRLRLKESNWNVVIPTSNVGFRQCVNIDGKSYVVTVDLSICNDEITKADL